MHVARQRRPPLEVIRFLAQQPPFAHGIEHRLRPLRWRQRDAFHTTERSHKLSPRPRGQHRIGRIEHQNKKRPMRFGQLCQPPRVIRRQRIKVARHQRRAGRFQQRPRIAPAKNLPACVQAFYLSSSRAVRATMSASTPFMQRWSIGHSRSLHGLHSTGTRTIRVCSPEGPVPM